MASAGTAASRSSRALTCSMVSTLTSAPVPLCLVMAAPARWRGIPPE